jgi:FK506-binding protein 4/5
MYFKVKDYANSEGSADEVLSLDPENVKALVRKAQIIASRPAGDVEVAFNLCKRAVEADPNHKDAKKWFAALQKKWRKEVAKQKKMYAGMFDKVSLVSDAEVAAAKAKPQPNPSFDTSEDEEEVEGKGL